VTAGAWIRVEPGCDLPEPGDPVLLIEWWDSEWSISTGFVITNRDIHGRSVPRGWQVFGEDPSPKGDDGPRETFFMSGGVGRRVTHWMPLPAPPGDM
jgi:hypothetical protein